MGSIGWPPALRGGAAVGSGGQRSAAAGQGAGGAGWAEGESGPRRIPAQAAEMHAPKSQRLPCGLEAVGATAHPPAPLPPAAPSAAAPAAPAAWRRLARPRRGLLPYSTSSCSTAFAQEGFLNLPPDSITPLTLPSAP